MNIINTMQAPPSPNPPSPKHDPRPRDTSPVTSTVLYDSSTSSAWPTRTSATRASVTGARWEGRLDGGTVGGFGRLPGRRQVPACDMDCSAANAEEMAYATENGDADVGTEADEWERRKWDRREWRRVMERRREEGRGVRVFGRVRVPVGLQRAAAGRGESGSGGEVVGRGIVDEGIGGETTSISVSSSSEASSEDTGEEGEERERERSRHRSSECYTRDTSNTMWTKISTELVDPEVLEEEGEGFEARHDCVVVYRKLTRDEVQSYVHSTYIIRERRRAKQRRRRDPRIRYGSVPVEDGSGVQGAESAGSESEELEYESTAGTGGKTEVGVAALGELEQLKESWEGRSISADVPENEPGFLFSLERDRFILVRDDAKMEQSHRQERERDERETKVDDATVDDENDMNKRVAWLGW